MNELDIEGTLKSLHSQFPNFTLDDLFKIIDCIKLKSRKISNNTYLESEIFNYNGRK